MHQPLTREEVRTLQEKALAIYENNYVADVRSRLALILTEENYSMYYKYVAPERNVLKRITSIESVVYQRAPWRRCEDADVIDAINEYASRLDRQLYEAEKLTYGLADIFVMPYWDEEKERVDYDIITPDKVEVSVKRASVQYVEITLIRDGKKVYTRYYASGRTEESTDRTKWKRIRNIFETHKISPVVWISLKSPTEAQPWSIGEIRDIINTTINVGVNETYRNRGQFLRAQRIPTLKNPADALEATGAAVGADNKIPLDMSNILKGDFGALSLSDENDKFLGSIQSDIADCAASRGISSATYNKTVATKDSLSAISEELKLRWRQSRTLFADPEKSLLKISLILINKYKKLSLNVDVKWTIEYLEPLPSIDDPRVALEVLIKGMTEGVDSPVAYLMRTNPDINTEKEALDYIDKNAEIRAKVVELMRELNAPANGDPGLTPEQNGARGPLVVPAEIDPNSQMNMNRGDNNNG